MLAFLLDIIFGDPAWFPHPVKLMGKAISGLEPLLRRVIPWERLAGLVLVVLIVGGSYMITGMVVAAVYELNPGLGFILSAIVIWTTLALKDMAVHARWVLFQLRGGDVTKARLYLAMIVGRDTERLGESEVVRACVESVAENTVDGIVSPLFFAFIGGAPLAMAFKAVSTLDSMVGYKTDQYLRFGWAAARLDDVANWVPARICGVLMTFSALFCSLSFRDSWRILKRDHANHESPNAGVPEAALAGALKVQLGGASSYDGERVEKPTIGDPIRALSLDRIAEAIEVMYVTAFMAIFIGFVVSTMVQLPLYNM
jgi:adenosylcobinamide-phosphate synthase